MIVVLSVMDQPKDALEDAIFQKYRGVYFFYSEFHSVGLKAAAKELFLFILDYADKIVHFTLYACLSLIFFIDYRNRKGNSTHPYILSAFVAFFVGYFCEVCQSFTATRSYSINDIKTNAMGAATSMLILFLITKIYEHRKLHPSVGRKRIKRAQRHRQNKTD